jgi:hypothetical protein
MPRYSDTTNAIYTTLDGVTVTGSSVMVSACLVDETGTAYGVKQVNGKPRVSSMPYTYDIAEGNVTDHRRWRLLGYNGDVDAAEETVWNVGGLYAFPAAASTLEVISDSTHDDDGGNGARTVRFVYLDAAYREHTETVTMNGTVGVATSASDIYRINRVDVLTAGSANSAVGNIDIRDRATTPIYGRINAGRGRGAFGTYTVPYDHTVYVTSMYVAAGGTTAGKYGEFRLKINMDADGSPLGNVMREHMLILVEDGGEDVSFTVPIPVTGCADMRIDVKSDSSNSNAIMALVMGGWEES